MPLRNRVTPFGEIEVHPARGTLMGNRGILHGDDRTLGARRWAHRAWIVCVLSFRGRRRVVMTPGRYTELFFLDEAVALAAGHRACAECRNAAYRRYRELWREAHDDPLAGAARSTGRSTPPACRPAPGPKSGTARRSTVCRTAPSSASSTPVPRCSSTATGSFPSPLRATARRSGALPASRPRS